MTLALDTDVLVAWTMRSSTRHEAALRIIGEERQASDAALALAPQVLFELLHVVTDPRRFETPLPMAVATERVEALWSAPDCVRVLPRPDLPARVAQLLRLHVLGRKRILDTALAGGRRDSASRHVQSG